MEAGTAYILHNKISASQLITMGVDFEEQQYIYMISCPLFQSLTHLWKGSGWLLISTHWDRIQLTNKRQDYKLGAMYYNKKSPPGSMYNTFICPGCISCILMMINPSSRKRKCQRSNFTYHRPLLCPPTLSVIYGFIE